LADLVESNHLPLIPAQAGIQGQLATSIVFALGPRFRGDERIIAWLERRKPASSTFFSAVRSRLFINSIKELMDADG
jgi:hypothetical protein